MDRGMRRCVRWGFLVARYLRPAAESADRWQAAFLVRKRWQQWVSQEVARKKQSWRLLMKDLELRCWQEVLGGRR